MKLCTSAMGAYVTLAVQREETLKEETKDDT